MCLKKKLMIIGLMIIAGVTFSVNSAYACWPWINVNDYRLEPDRRARFHLAHGHAFPFGRGFFDSERIGEMYILGPDGERGETRPRVFRGGRLCPMQFESKERLGEGTYLVVMETRGDFFARTTEGWQRKSAEELKDKEGVDKVIYFQMWAKAVVNAGEGGGEVFSRVLGHGLEIVPLKNPNELRPNDFLPIQILHNGEPLEESVKVHAIYMGFSTDEDVFASTSLASPCEEGKVKIKILEPGIWKIYVKAEIPFLDRGLADQHSYRSTLTFEVGP